MCVFCFLLLLQSLAGPLLIAIIYFFNDLERERTLEDVHSLHTLFAPSGLDSKDGVDEQNDVSDVDDLIGVEVAVLLLREQDPHAQSSR